MLNVEVHTPVSASVRVLQPLPMVGTVYVVGEVGL
jgi:hypothetical protein